MEFVSLLFILMVAIHRPTSSTIVLADFQQQALLQHNYFRGFHCTGAMTLNLTLNAIVQNYSQYLAANNLFNHSGTAGLGENLWAISSSIVITFVNGKEYKTYVKKIMNTYTSDYLLGSTPTTSWYNEISMYNYNSPGYSSTTGHFTQVIWKDSVQLGIGIHFPVIIKVLQS